MAAPLVNEATDKKITVKRNAEEIFYGNHQNAPREKKSVKMSDDKVLKLPNEPVIGNQKTIPVPAVSIESNPDHKTKVSLVEELKNKSQESNIKSDEITSVESEDNLNEDTEGWEDEQLLQTLEDYKDTSNKDSSSELPSAEDDAAYENDLFENKRKKRALTAPKALVAEDMNVKASVSKPIRSKRDLTLSPEDIAYLLRQEELEETRDDNDDDENDDNDDRDDSYPNEEALEDIVERLSPEKLEYLKNLESKKFEDDDDDGNDDDEADEDEKAKLLALLKLVANGKLQSTFFPDNDGNEKDDDDEEENREDIIKRDVESVLEKIGADEDSEYIPIIYEGVPGVFVPLPRKREYYSLMPGLRKRSSSYFEDSMPDRMMDQERDYTRLFQLAEKLGAPENVQKRE